MKKNERQTKSVADVGSSAVLGHMVEPTINDIIQLADCKEDGKYVTFTCKVSDESFEYIQERWL